MKDACRHDEEEFKGWNAKRVADCLRNLGLKTNKTGGKRRYGRVSLEELRRIQMTYGYDLGIRPGKDT